MWCTSAVPPAVHTIIIIKDRPDIKPSLNRPTCSCMLGYVKYRRAYDNAAETLPPQRSTEVTNYLMCCVSHADTYTDAIVLSYIKVNLTCIKYAHFKNTW